MNIDKKYIFIAIGIALGLIMILLVAIVIFGNKNETKKVDFSMNSTKAVANTSSKEENIVENPEKNEKEDTREKIEGDITYEKTADGVEIPIPPTFKYVEGESWHGAIIEDKDGNQFVWVPVEEYNKYTRQFFANNGEDKSADNEATLEESNIKDILSYNPDYDDSIRNYKGFYVARYEAGKENKNGNNYAISKADVLPWTQVTWQMAKNASEDMYVENESFSTDLINSYAWDTICNWLRDTGTNIDDSVEYGNYQNSANGLNMVTKSASNSKWQTNNIFDMGGNVWEYTTEEIGDHEIKHIGRGGGYWNEGDKYPISCRASTEDGSNLDIGFRVVLYLK